LSYVSHEVDLVAETFFPIVSSFAVTAQICWNLDFFSIEDGLLPSGGSRSRLLLTSFVGFDIGAGVAYSIGKRCLLEGKGVFRLIAFNTATGGGAFDSLGTE
jgi:hypothetical protein